LLDSLSVVRAGANPKAMALAFVLGTVLAGIPYLFIMPHLSSYAELGLMIFGGCFAIGYLAPKMKTGLLAMFLRFISVQNEQTYSFLAWADGLTMIVLASALVIAIAYIPTSPRPEKVFLRLYRRFYRHSGFLISGLASDGQRLKGITGRWRAVFYRNDLLELPGKLAACGGKIDYRVLPATTLEQVQDLVSSLYVLAFRIKELVEAGAHPQAELVRERLRDDLQSWHQVIAARFERRGVQESVSDAR